MSHLYIGLMSGTSADGIDAVLVDFSGSKPELLVSQYTPYAGELRQQILDLTQPGENEIIRLGELDVILADTFATCIQALLTAAGVSANEVSAIGSHGHTIRHAPSSTHRFTMQIGDPNTIAAKTGITTVADFRRKDMALGGQGAPLVPAFHKSVFGNSEKNCTVLNIGGIANITLLTKGSDGVLGFDTGPGNTLMDQWIQLHEKQTHDVGGAWAARGNVNTALLSALLNDSYFKLAPPKSTGREYFNLEWLNAYLANHDELSAIDVQATLAELTAVSITDCIKTHMPDGDILVCGGGAHNAHLMSRISALTAPHFHVTTTQTHGIHPDWVEAIAFAWLAYQTMEKRAGNVPSVTGASQEAILGGVYYA